MGKILQILGLIALSHTENLPLGRSALWLALVRAIGWRAALSVSVGLILLRALSRRGAEPAYGRRRDRQREVISPDRAP
jgi:hypothetical protein